MRALVLLAATLIAVSACGSREPRQQEMRMMSDSFYFTIIPHESPPRAREAILYKVIVRDKETRQPIETGEGQIYASNREGASTWDGFEKGAEVGTYYGKLNFVTAELWAVAIRFRRDSLQPLEKVEWMQDVLNEREDPIR